MIAALHCLFPLLLCVGTHTADFARTDSPNGLSRRGYVGNPGPLGNYDHGATDWRQEFIGDRYWLLNPDANVTTDGINGWSCVDLGTGVGSATLPGPLIGGGAFTSAAPAAQPGFGPYAVPLVFETQFQDWGEFTAAQIAVDSPPSGATALANRKALGVTLVINNQEGSVVARQMTAGVYDTGSGPRLDIVDNSVASLSTGGPVTITGLAAGDAWTLRVTIGASSVTADVVKNGATIHTVTANRVVPGGNFVAALSTKSAALRASGYVTAFAPPNIAIEVLRIVITSANVPSFNGPPTGSSGPAASTRGFLQRRGSELYLDKTADPAQGVLGGGKLQASGTNCVDLLNYFAGFDATPEYGEYVMDQLVASSDQRVIRFSCGEQYSKYTRTFNFPGWEQSNYPLQELFDENLTTHDAYFSAFDRMVDAATARGIYLVPVLVWSPEEPYAYVNDADAFSGGVSADNARHTFNIGSGPQTPAETAAQNFVVRWCRDIVLRYKDHPTILYWEVGNEWDNEVVHSLLAWPATPIWPEVWNQPEECANASTYVAGLIRNSGTDARHLISSGYAGTARLYDDPAISGKQQNVATCELVTRRYYTSAIDLMSLHLYASGQTTSGCSTDCQGWDPAPYANWEACLHGAQQTGASLFSGTGDDSRPVVIGETNFNTGWTYNATDWQHLLDAYAGTSGNGATPRAQVVLTWDWMTVPHLAFEDLFNIVPADFSVSNPNLDANRAYRFEQFTDAVAAAPRILSSGFGTTYAKINQFVQANVRVRVADLQGDVTSVQVLNAGGTNVLANLINTSGNEWTGTAPNPSPKFTSPTHMFWQIRATDAQGHVSVYAPRETFAPPVPGLGPTPTGADLVNGGTAPNLPYVRTAGYFGFNPVSRESVTPTGSHNLVIAEIVDANGSPLTGTGIAVYGRWNTDGTLAPTTGWTNTLFAFYDDGTHGDFVSGDGVWTSDVATTTAQLNAIASQELLFEVSASKVSGSTTYYSDIWPRVVVH